MHQTDDDAMRRSLTIVVTRLVCYPGQVDFSVAYYEPLQRFLHGHNLRYPTYLGGQGK